MGGAVAAIDYMKHALVESNTERVRRIEVGEQIVVGVNRWTETETSPLSDRRGLHRGRRSGHREGAGRAARGLARVARRQGGEEGAGRAGARGTRRPQRHGAVDRLRQGRRHHRRVGHDAARACSASTGRRRASRAAWPRPARSASTTCAARSSACRLGSGAASSCWSASPASTATPTAPSRSRCGRATAAWRWSTRASG